MGELTTRQIAGLYAAFGAAGGVIGTALGLTGIGHWLLCQLC